MEQQQQLVTIEEAAILLSTSRDTVRRMIAAGAFPVVRLRRNGHLRIALEDITSFIKEQRAAASRGE
jgi:excisionase family DNA binding protein